MTQARSEETLDNQYYQVAEVAERWQCSTRHVRRVIASGDLPVHRFGKLVRISHADLRTYEKINRAD